MVLKQAAQQCPPDRLKLSLQLPVLEPRRRSRLQPADDLVKPLTRAGERILASTITRREIHCSSISRALALQDFISRRVKLAVTGAGVGDHVVRPFVVDVDISNANFGIRERFSCDLSPSRRRNRGETTAHR